VTARTLLLNAADVTCLRGGETVMVGDSDNHSVSVSMHEHPGSGQPGLTLSTADLKVAAEPEGLVCGSVDRTTDWTVRVGS
jgi:hypothetical protein